MLTFNEVTLTTVIATAKQSAANDPRWLTAIDKAAIELVSNPYIEMIDGDLIIASATSGNVYHVNGHCDCMAGVNGKPCKHRAMKRIIQRYNEVVARKEAAAKALQAVNELF